MNKSERISHLLKLYLAGNITGTELQEFKDLLLQGKSETAFQEELDTLIGNSPAIPDYEEATWEPLYQKIWEARDTGVERSSGPGRVVRLFRKRGWAAAVVLILLAAGSWLLFLKHPGKEMARMVTLPQQPAGDVAPGSNKAVLTLADGSTIDLNAAGNGLLGRQGNSKLIKIKGGQLAYEAANGKLSAAGEASFNTIATPRGGQYQLVLPDGSKVWLNAASSLRYPTAFSGKERMVELKGEAYFEVV